MSDLDIKNDGQDSGQQAGRSGRKKAQSGSVSRRLILDVAAGLFSEQGFTETTMRQIAAKVGMQAGSVYYHFNSKEQILSEILSIAVRSTYMAVRDSVEKLPPQATPRDRIVAALSSHLQALHGNIHYTSTNVKFLGQVPEEVEQNVQPDRAQYEDYWNQLLHDALAAGALQPNLSVPMLRPLILGSLNRTVVWFDPSRGNLDDLIATILTLFNGMWSRP